jgi:HlyD family secretion protein
VTAPESGRVLSIYTESERVVQAGTQLVEIGDPRDLEIVVDLLTNDSVKIAAGAEVRISRWGGESDLAGRVRHIEPGGYTKVSALGIEEQRVNVIVDLVSDPQAWRSLGNGFRVFVHITQWHEDKVLRVPVSALFRTTDQWAVYQVAGDHVALVEVEIGNVNQRFAQVKSGLAAGDQIVLHPSDRVADGVAIVDRASM